jgi:hypothetical protein
LLLQVPLPLLAEIQFNNADDPIWLERQQGLPTTTQVAEPGAIEKFP